DCMYLLSTARPPCRIRRESDDRMTPQRAPWWMVVLAVPFAAITALFLYLFIWGPADLQGLDIAFSENQLLVTRVTPGSQPASAGLEIGDRILSIDDRLMRTPRTWTAAHSNRRVGVPQSWEIQRGNRRFVVTMTPARATLKERFVFGSPIYAAFALSCFLVG